MSGSPYPLFFLLCLQAFGLMPGIGGLVTGEEGLAANCTTRLMSAEMGQRHGSDIPLFLFLYEFFHQPFLIAIFHYLAGLAFPVFFLER